MLRAYNTAATAAAIIISSSILIQRATCEKTLENTNDYRFLNQLDIMSLYIYNRKLNDNISLLLCRTVVKNSYVFT